jgi:hypothetical protein
VLRAKREMARMNRVLRRNPFMNVLTIARHLPVTKQAIDEYPLADDTHEGIQGSVAAIGEELGEIETREGALSNFFRDAASADVERSNRAIQRAMIWLTIATVIFGAMALVFEVSDQEFKNRIANMIGVSRQPVLPPQFPGGRHP